MTEQSETLIKAGPDFPELKTASPCQLTQALSELDTAMGTGTAWPSPGPWLRALLLPRAASDPPSLARNSKDHFHVSKTISTLRITELETSTRRKERENSEHRGRRQ